MCSLLVHSHSSPPLAVATEITDDEHTDRHKPSLDPSPVSEHNLTLLHACVHCRESKTACADARQCACCRRLGLDCSTDRDGPRKRSCHACHAAKVACGAIFSDGKCSRCTRLGLECVARGKPNPGARIRRNGKRPHGMDDALGLSTGFTLVSGPNGALYAAAESAYNYPPPSLAVRPAPPHLGGEVVLVERAAYQAAHIAVPQAPSQAAPQPQAAPVYYYLPDGRIAQQVGGLPQVALSEP